MFASFMMLFMIAMITSLMIASLPQATRSGLRISLHTFWLLSQYLYAFHMLVNHAVTHAFAAVPLVQLTVMR